MPGANLTQCVVYPMRTAALAAALFALGACTARPFQPNPPAYTMWGKKGVTEDGVRAAMHDCGFASATSNDGVNMTGNDYAGAELCMIDNGFLYKGGALPAPTFRSGRPAPGCRAARPLEPIPISIRRGWQAGQRGRRPIRTGLAQGPMSKVSSTR